MHRKGVVFVVIILFVLNIAGCSQFNTSRIGDLLKDPRQYEGQAVIIEGKVIDSQSLLVVKYFTVEDKTGKIIVVTDRVLPQVGQSERVRGKVNEAFAIGSARMIVLVEEPLDK